MPQLTTHDPAASTTTVPATADQDAERLTDLLEAVGGLDLEDREGWSALSVAAAALIERLAISGRITPALLLAPTDPPVVVARTVAVVSRSLAGRDAPARCA